MVIPSHFLQLNILNLMSSRTTVPISSHLHTTCLASPSQTLLEVSSFSPDAGCLGPTYSSRSHPAQALALSCSTVYLVLLNDQALFLLLRSITIGSLEPSSSYGFWERSASCSSSLPTCLFSWSGVLWLLQVPPGGLTSCCPEVPKLLSHIRHTHQQGF